MQTNNNMILQFSTRNDGNILEEVKLFLMSIKNNMMFVSREKKNLACGENIPLLPKYENPNFS